MPARLVHPNVPCRLSHELAHYRLRFPSSSIVTYMFSCRSPRFCASAQGQFRTADCPGQQEQRIGVGVGPFEGLHADTRSTVSGPMALA